MMMGFSFGFGFLMALATLGALCGVVVLVSAVLLNTRPRQAMTYRAILLVFSPIGLFGMGGFFAGAILGTIGGALALAWQGPRALRA